MAAASLPVLLLLLSCACVSATADGCAACALVMQRLGAVRDTARLALEPARQAGTKAAAASTRSGTKRWLKDEHAVALHSAV